MSYVIIVGNPFDGISIYGRLNESDDKVVGFDSPDDANEIADMTFHGYDWWVVELRAISDDQN